VKTVVWDLIYNLGNLPSEGFANLLRCTVVVSPWIPTKIIGPS
jgi:hypothetical protein